MKESMHADMGGFLDHVCQHDLFKCGQILNIISNVQHEKFKWLNTYGFA